MTSSREFLSTFVAETQLSDRPRCFCIDFDLWLFGSWMTVMAFQGKHAETLERKHHQRVMKRLAMPSAPMPLRIPAMAVLPFLVLFVSAVASVTAPGSCGVSKPLFKARHGETWRDMARHGECSTDRFLRCQDSSIKVEPIDTHNWLQIGFSAFDEISMFTRCSHYLQLNRRPAL